MTDHEVPSLVPPPKPSPEALPQLLRLRVRELRETMRAITTLDFVPHPCPENVHPEWRTETERARAAGVRAELRQAIARADGLSAQALGLLEV